MKRIFIGLLLSSFLNVGIGAESHGNKICNWDKARTKSLKSEEVKKEKEEVVEDERKNSSNA